jgi:2-dehydro-3-deoxyglucarate aldolase/4-hydroxy-2-oxoheptanedioate aldolase
VRANALKRKLKNGETSFGTMVFEFDSPGIARLAAVAGAEFVMYDTEHSGWGIETVRRLMAYHRATDTVPLVRVPATEYHLVAPVLDAGAMGVMAPMVHDAEQARAVVSFVKYPPAGQRGVAFKLAHDDYRPGDNLTKMREANDESLVITQIESTEALANVDDIAATEGVDVLWIGQGDLSTSLGKPFQFDDPRFLAALDKVVASAEAHGKAAAYAPTSVEQGKQMLARGFRCICYSGDLWIYGEALGDALTRLRR